MSYMHNQLSMANRGRNGAAPGLEGAMNDYGKCSVINCNRRSRRDVRTIPIPPQSASRPVSPTITVSLDRLLDALEFDPEWTPSAEALQRGYDDWEECHYPPATSDPELNPAMDPECEECCREAAELIPVSDDTEEESEPIPAEKRKKIVLGPDGEPDIISDIESEEDEREMGIMANISPPVVLPKKELVYHVNVLGEDGCLEIDRIDDKHPLPNCMLRNLAKDSYTTFFPPLYVQGVCSEILDPDIPAPRWLGEEFDKTEEEMERDRKAEDRVKLEEIEYEF